MRSLLSFFLLFVVIACSSTESRNDENEKSQIFTESESSVRKEIDEEYITEEQRSELFRTDRSYSEDYSGEGENRDEKRLKAIWRESECKKLLPPCIASCQGSKALRYLLLRFVIGDDDCESHCRAQNDCPAEP